MINVLELCASLDGGGVDRLVFEYSTRLMDEFHFDFVVTSLNEGMLEKQLVKMGCNVFHVKQMSDAPIQYFSKLNRIIRKGKYSIVHDHMNQASFGSMLVSFFNKVPVRIAHAHTCILNEGFIRKLKRKAMTQISLICSTCIFACGNDAAKWMWGKKSPNCYIMKNAIDLKKYNYSKKKRETLRNEYHLQNSFVIGNVARLSDEKNQAFLIDVFKEILSQKPDSFLFLVGGGEKEDELRKKVKEMNLTSKVIFLGVRNDVHNLLNMFDSFVLPSKYEGLPVTLVEVQANGLPVVVSNNVTNEIALSKAYKILSLNDSLTSWAECILANDKRQDIIEKQLMEYDINVSAEKLKNKYKELLYNR